jgi:hypothetical protein
MKYLKVLCSLMIVLCVSFIFTGQKAYASNADEIYQFMRDIGCNHAVAIAVLVNIECDGYYYIHYHNDIDTILRDSGYYGICLWSGSRLANLKSFCIRNGLSASSLYGQLKFLEYELEERGMLAQLKSYPNTSSGAYDAAYYFAVKFLECGGPSYRARLASNRF